MFAKRDKHYPSRSGQTSLATTVTKVTKPVRQKNFGPSTYLHLTLSAPIRTALYPNASRDERREEDEEGENGRRRSQKEEAGQLIRIDGPKRNKASSKVCCVECGGQGRGRTLLLLHQLIVLVENGCCSEVW